MAKYTTQIRSIVEAKHPIFDFDYPIFDEAYRSVLEQKIINRYYFREIGFETVGQFKWYLKTKLNEIMPYYNERYLALEVFKTYNPYVNKDMETKETRTSTQKGDGSSKSKDGYYDVGSTHSDTKDIFSDTPQGKLSGLDYATNVTTTDNYGSNHFTHDGDSSLTSESHIQSTDEYIQTIKGFDGMKYASEVYEGVKDTIVNLDVMILDELNELFMNIY